MISDADDGSQKPVRQRAEPDTLASASASATARVSATAHQRLHWCTTALANHVAVAAKAFLQEDAHLQPSSCGCICK
jgi:hypothetical protein